MTALRFTLKTHPIILAKFVDAVSEAAKNNGLSLVVYEDGRVDKIDYWKHLRPGVFTWHAISRAFKWLGVTYGCAADLNVSGKPGMSEEQFFKTIVWPIAKSYGVAIRWEGGTHAHADCGGDNAFGGDSRIPGNVPTGYRVGSVDVAKTGCISIDGGFGPQTVRKIQSIAKLPQTGKMDVATVKWIQARLGGIAVDGQFGPATRKRWCYRLGTKVQWTTGAPPRWVAQAIQIHLVLDSNIF